MAKKKATKKQVIPLSMLPFTSDSYDHLVRMKFMAETIILHQYMGIGADIERIYAHVVETKDMKANCDLPEVVEYVNKIKSFNLKYAIQIDVDLYEKEEPIEEGDIDDL